MIGRIRTVKPEIFSDEKLWDLSLETGLPLLQAFEGLWCYADREGRFEWRPRALKTLILPYWEGDFQRALEALERGRYVVRYVVDGQTYGVVRGFSKHQRVNQREAQSTIPSPPVTALHVQAPGEGKGRELEGKGREGARADAPPAPVSEIHPVPATDPDPRNQTQTAQLPPVPGLVVVGFAGPLQPSRWDQASALPSGPPGPSKFEYDPAWGPTKANQARGHELGLTDEEIWARWNSVRDKPYPRPFRDDEKQFNRELAWAAADKTKNSFQSRQAQKDFETPGHRRRA